MKRFLSLLLSLVCTITVAAERFPFKHQETLTLHVGKVETLRVRDIERVAVGHDSFISTHILSPEELLIIPQRSGSTDLVVWHTGNRKSLFQVVVRDQDPNSVLKDVRQRLQLYPGLRVSIENGNVLVRGEVGSDAQLADIRERLGKSLQEQVRINVHVDQSRMIENALADMPNLRVLNQDGWISISGSYAPEDREVLEQVLKVCSNCVNSAQEDRASNKSMVMVDVQILEVRRRHLEKLGVRWASTLGGPAAGIALTGGNTELFQSFTPTPGAQNIANGLPAGFKGAAGSVGLITQLDSQLDLLKEAGEARMLARPMLSTRDGTPSTFHSGGEIPYPVIDARTGNVGVEFRDYGVLLTILPRVSKARAGVTVEINAEVSSIDQAIAINGVPGLVSKSVSSVVTSRLGETIVLSGLMSIEQDKGSSALPGLGEIPWIGRLFRSELDDVNHRELAVFLTPHLTATESDTDNSALPKLGEQLQEIMTPMAKTSIAGSIKE